MKTYKANKKGFIRYLLVGFLLLPILIFYLDKNTFIGKPFILLPLLSPLALITWVYFDTYYKIDEKSLLYRSAFLRGKIAILDIKEIQKGKTMWSGIKPALAKNGLIIKYSKYDEIYLAPENNDEMVADLLKINPKIEVYE